MKKYQVLLITLVLFIAYLSIAEIGRTGQVLDGVEKFFSLSFIALFGWTLSFFKDN
jgi:hypothetical protein